LTAITRSISATLQSASPAQRHPGVVGHHLNRAAACLRRSGQRGVPGGRIAHVEPMGRPAPDRQQRAGLRHARHIDIGQRHEPARLRKALRDGAADARGAAGHEQAAAHSAGLA
jgi:hypothetical protein